MKRMILLLLICIIDVDVIRAAYEAQKCYVCDLKVCDHPGASDIKDCSDSANGGTSGKDFVNGAFNSTTDIYGQMAADLKTFGTSTLGINQSAMPSWEILTRWVCYVSKDKHRGCLVMGKGLCDKDKSWLTQISEIGDKLTNILQKAKKSISEMFSDKNIDARITSVQKSNISEWIATNYMSVLVKNDAGPEYSLDTCCEGNACNSAVSAMASLLLTALALAVVQNTH